MKTAATAATPSKAAATSSSTVKDWRAAWRCHNVNDGFADDVSVEFNNSFAGSMGRGLDRGFAGGVINGSFASNTNVGGNQGFASDTNVASIVTS